MHVTVFLNKIEQEFGGPLLENRLEIYCRLQYFQFDNSTCTVSSTTVLSVQQAKWKFTCGHDQFLKIELGRANIT